MRVCCRRPAQVNDTALNLTFVSYPSTAALTWAAQNGTFCAGDLVHLETWASCDYIWTEVRRRSHVYSCICIYIYIYTYVYIVYYSSDRGRRI